MGDKHRYVGNCTVRRRGAEWNFENLAFTDQGRKKVDTSNDVNDVRLPVVPAGGLDVDASSSLIRIRTAVAELQSFMNAVVSLERGVLDREERLFTKLKEVASPGRSWTVTSPNLNGQPTEWTVEFVTCDLKDDPDLVRAVIRDSKNELQRAVYDGKVLRGTVDEPDRFTRPIRHAPQVTLKCQSGGQSLLFIPPHGRQPVIRFDAKGESPRFQVPTYDSAMTPRTAGPLSSTDADLWNRLLERIKPGTQWAGTVRTVNHGDDRVLLTVTEAQPDGSYVRILAEAPSDPVAAVVYEGSCRQDQLHGWPLTLTIASGLRSDATPSELFNYERVFAGVPLTLTLNEKGFIGRRGPDQVELVSSKSVAGGPDRATQAKTAFGAGAKYKGRLSGIRGEDLGEIAVTVAEVRDSGSYVRVLVNSTETPQDVVTYEGRLRNENGYVDGYCLELQKRTRGWHEHGLLNQHIDPISLSLRLGSDGVGCFGAVVLERTRVFEKLKLTRVADDSKSRSLATQDAAALILSKLAKGAVWRGQYKSTQLGKTGDVSLRVVESSDAGMIVELTSSNLVGGKITYEGLLRLDDLYVNGTFASLQKTIGGKLPVIRSTLRSSLASSTPPPTLVDLFDSTTGRERMLHLTLSQDGDVLYGVSGSQDRIDHKYGELLTLRNTIAPRPAGTSAPPPKTTTTPTGPTPFTVSTPPTTAPSSGSPPGPARIWTSADGKFSTTAGPVRLVGNNLTLRRTDGAMIDIPVDRLSEADQEHLRRFPPPAN